MSNTNESRHPNDDITNFQTLDGLQIVVVDDDADSLVLTTFILESYGVQTVTATSALQALEVIKQSVPNVLIIDIAMPEVDGYSLIRKVRTLNSPQNEIPAIALTAMHLEEGPDLALKAGFQSYLIKPSDPNDILTEIVNIITKKA